MRHVVLHLSVVTARPRATPRISPLKRASPLLDPEARANSRLRPPTPATSPEASA